MSGWQTSSSFAVIRVPFGGLGVLFDFRSLSSLSFSLFRSLSFGRTLSFCAGALWFEFEVDAARGLKYRLTFYRKQNASRTAVHLAGGATWGATTAGGVGADEGCITDGRGGVVLRAKYSANVSRSNSRTPRSIRGLSKIASRLLNQKLSELVQRTSDSSSISIHDCTWEWIIS